ncbi:uncharacterized protein LOC106088237 [Stomoxys calcitrans]|uniref:uncharacterized protein LOC106088237 n=1 Tax=Stomoxys calcitrans TaxID=35570 RepID=UPI0027E3AAC7|nr:uncharacterized protein LOC106088237 [Stomoxys calcitrans]
MTKMGVVHIKPFQNDHQPNTFMEHFCHTIHPDLQLATMCFNWFEQAIKHCQKKMTVVATPSYYLWTKIKNTIFPPVNTELMSPTQPIPIHPKRLSLINCQDLQGKIIRDYLQLTQRNAAESAINALLWQIMLALMGVVALVTLLLVAMNKYGKIPSRPRGRKKSELGVTCNVLQSINAKRSLNRAKYELRLLKIRPLLQPEDLLAPDGSPTMVIKISSKLSFLQSLVSGELETATRLYRLPKYQRESLRAYKFQRETLQKALEFLDETKGKLRLLLVFEKDVATETFNSQIGEGDENTKTLQLVSEAVAQWDHVDIQRTSGVETLDESLCYSDIDTGDRTLTPRFSLAYEKEVSEAGLKSARSLESPQKKKLPSKSIDTCIPRASPVGKKLSFEEKMPTSVADRNTPRSSVVGKAGSSLSNSPQKTQISNRHSKPGSSGIPSPKFHSRLAPSVIAKK